MLSSHLVVSVLCTSHFILKTVVGVDLHPQRRADIFLNLVVQKVLSLNPYIFVTVFRRQLIVRLRVFSVL